MRQLHCVLCLLFVASLLLSSSRSQHLPCSENIDNDDDTVIEIIRSHDSTQNPANLTFNIVCDNKTQTAIIDPSVSSRAITVWAEYRPCSDMSICPNYTRQLIDAECSNGMWKARNAEEISEEIMEDNRTDCSKCVNKQLFMEYPSVPASLEHDETTHCLKLPECKNGDETVGFLAARDCCVEITESTSYKWGVNDEDPRTFTCVVHGFSQTKYTVNEGESLQIAFYRNVKGMTSLSRLQLNGEVTASGNLEDVSIMTVTSSGVTGITGIPVTVLDDNITLERGDHVILTHVSSFPNFENAAAGLGNFISSKTTIYINDDLDLKLNFTSPITDEQVIAEDGVLQSIKLIGNKPAQESFPVVLTASETTLDIRDEYKAVAGRDFTGSSTLNVTYRGGTGVSIDTSGILIDDNTVEFNKRFKLKLEIEDPDVRFAEHDDRSVTFEATITDQDSATIRIRDEGLMFSEDNPGPFHVCVTTMPKGDSQSVDCPIDVPVIFTLNFTKYSNSSREKDPSTNHQPFARCENVTLNRCESEVCIDFKTVYEFKDDNIYHRQKFEVFLLSEYFPLTYDNSTILNESLSINVDGETHEFEIEEDDILELALEQTEYGVFENLSKTVMVEVCLIAINNFTNSECPIDVAFYYKVATDSGTASPDNDYVALGPPHARKKGTMRFEKCNKIDCFNIEIVNDDISEGEEYFEFTLSLENDGAKYANLTQKKGKIYIFDPPTFELKKTEVVGTEADGNASICVEITYDVDRARALNIKGNKTVDLHPMPYSGPSPPKTADNDDYDNSVKTIVFVIGNETTNCTSIDIVDDDTVEEDTDFFRERFKVELTSDELLVSGESTVDVLIKENDKIMVRLYKPDTNVSEGENLKICAEVMNKSDCPIQFNAAVAFVSPPGMGTATPGMGKDYSPLSFQKAIKPCHNETCVNLTVYDDDILELPETLYIFVDRSPGLSPNVMVKQEQFLVYINDTDENMMYPNSSTGDSVTEGGSIEYCLGVKYPLPDVPCQIQFNLTLMLTVNETGFEQELISLKSCDKLTGDHCVTIPIDDDDYLTASNREYTVGLKSKGDIGNITLGNKTLIVEENDVLTLNVTLLPNEIKEGSEIQFNIIPSMTKLCDVHVKFVINFTFGFGNYHDNHKSHSHNGSLDCDNNPNSLLLSAITVLDDSSVEADQMFYWNASLVPDSLPISLVGDFSGSRMIVNDDDKGVLFFGKDEYKVSEYEGSLEVCVHIKVIDASKDNTCPAAFEIPLMIETIPVTATAGEDYVSNPEEFTIPACTSEGCITIQILSDMDMNEEMELFILSLSLVSRNGVPRERLSIQTPTANVTITDEIVIHFDKEQYEVFDNESMVEICIVVNQQGRDCPGDVHVNYTTSADTAVPGEDYESIMNKTVISNCTNACIHITIHNSRQLKKKLSELSFSVSFTATQSDVGVTVQDTADVIITDTTEVHFVFDKTTYDAEENSTVTICIKMLGPLVDCPINFPFEFYMETIDGSAKPLCDYKNFSERVVDFDNNMTECKRCIEIEILGDKILEETEYFDLELTKLTLDERIVPVSSSARVNIIDAAIEVTVEFEKTAYTVYEDIGTLEICAYIECPCPVEPPFSYSVSVDGAESGELMLVNDTLEFEMCQNKSCIAVDIIDDMETYDKPETFPLIFTRSTEDVGSWLDNIKLSPTTITVTILDTIDNVTISMEPKEYHVKEDETDPIEVCAVLTHAVAFNFSVMFNLKGHGVDKTVQTTVESGGTEVCANLHFMPEVEPGKVKEYNVRVKRVGGSDDGINVDDTPAVIYVCDEVECVVDCYKNAGCTGERTSDSGSGSAKLCCTGSDESVSYMDRITNTCHLCIVHGFSSILYSVEEGDLAEVKFQKNVKGTSQFSNLDLLMVGKITPTSDGADREDYVLPKEVITENEGPYTIPTVTLNDDIALEVNDKVKFEFDPHHDGDNGINYIKMLEEAGEFLREATFLHIMDNDDLEINFDQISYEVTEGGTESVSFYHRRTEGEFNLILRNVDYEEFRILYPDRHRQQSQTLCPATPDEDYGVKRTDRTVRKSSSSTTWPRTTISSFISTKSDSINENDETYFLVASIELKETPMNTKVCFKKYEKDLDCTENGTALVRILDNDRITIGFERSYYSTNERDYIYTVIINSDRASERDYHLKIEYLEAKSDAIVETTANDSPEVDATMDSLTMYKIFPAGNRSIEFNVTLKGDNRNEGTECFYLYLTPEDHYRHEFSCTRSSSRSCEMRICLGDSSRACLIGFSSSAYTVFESERMVEVCVDMTCSSNSENTVTVDIYSTESGITTPHANKSYPNIACEYNPQDCEDYYGQLRGCNSMQDMIITEDSTVCGNVTIIDDERLEETEYAGLSLYVTSMTAKTSFARWSKTKIRINDEDTANIGFVGDVYVVEGAKAEVCVEVKSPNIECPIKKSFRVRILTSDDTAGSANDYIRYNRVIVFDACAKVKCVNITTVARYCEIEREEIFTVNLQKYGSGVIDRIQLDVNEISVYIRDNDTAIVTLEDADRGLRIYERLGPAQVDMAVRDANNPRVCFAGFPFLIGFESLRGTALDNEDFQKIGERIQFEANARMKTVNVGITDDKTVELYREEYFFVQLSTWGGQPPSITVDRRRLNITIIDDDTAKFGLERPACTVMEGNVFSLCVVQKPTIYADCPVRFDFPLTLTVMGEQTTSTDHNAMSTDVTMLECSRRVCKNITIIGDMSLEPDETFTISLEKPPDHDDRIILSLTRKDIVIDDKDTVTIEFVGMPEAIEDEGTLQVCLSITGSGGGSCPSSVDIHLRFTTRDVTARARSDYRSVSKTIIIPACAMSYCEDIVIIDSPTLEEDETFNVSISKTITNRNINDRIIIPEEKKTFTIYDNDFVDVKFDKTYIPVDEGRSFLVCVNVIPVEDTSCPVAFEFSIILNLHQGTATPEDYCNTHECELSIPACGERKCELIPICDDCNLEDFETFTIDMELGPDVPRRIRTDNDVVTVNITDNDVLTLQMEVTERRVNEDEGTVEVCATIQGSCRSSFNFQMRLRTVNNSAEYTGDSTDYNQASMVITFTPDSPRHCLSVDILDNEQVEQPEESFDVMLERVASTPDQVIIRQDWDKTEVVIVDDDFAILGFEQSMEMVDEERGEIELCIEVKSPVINYCPIVFPVIFTVTTTAMTAIEDDDYTAPSKLFRYNACEQKDCFVIEIINDDFVEETETFSVSIDFETGPAGNRLDLVNDTVIVSILDEDKAMVYIEYSSYKVNETDGVVEVCVISSVRMDVPFAVEFSTQEYGGTAKIGEDFELINDREIHFQPGTTRNCTTINITMNCILEELEVFKVTISEDVIISSHLSDRIYVDRKEAYVYIIDQRVLYVRPENDSIRVMEDAGVVEVCFLISDEIGEAECSNSKLFGINVTTFDDSADVPTDDYEPIINAQVYFQPYASRNCTSIRIVNDLTVEQEESFKVNISSYFKYHSHIRARGITEVFIDNEDHAVVGLERATYTVLENEELTICLSVDSPDTECPVAFPFDVDFDPTDGTAVFPSDYTLAKRNDNNRLRFEACANMSCLDIPLEDDFYIEDTEYFTITLVPSDDSFSIFIKLDPKVATVTIEDEDKAVVGFDNTMYSTTEGSVLTICLRVFTPSVSCPVRTPFNMTLHHAEHNATTPEDFTTTAELITVQFSRCARLSCANRVVRITQDREVEKLEYFRLVAESVDDSLTEADPSRTTIYIRDTDYATVQLTQTSFTATEAIDSFVTICAEMTYPPITDPDCPVTFEFTLKLSVGEDEYDVRFRACQRLVCVNANIVDDNRLEKTETYAIRLSRPSDVDSRIRLYRSTGRLTVYEDPTDTAHIDLIVTGDNTKREEDGYVEVCAEIVSPTVTNPVAFSFSVIIRTADGTAKRSSDYSYLSRTLYFSVGERKECVNVTIRNDHTQEMDEYFDVNLVRPSSLPNTITFTRSTQRITIIDADPAQVGLERSLYTVEEGEGPVRVCVTISTQRSTSCPVAYNISLNVVYLAGTASREDDFRDSGSSSTLGIPACTRKKCFDVIIIDNLQLEGTESFVVALLRNSLDEDIVFSRERATITITDDDTAQVQFTQVSYSVEESRSRTVCVRVISQNGCIIPLPFFVNITSSLLSRTPDPNKSKPAAQNDFTAVNVEVRFPICTGQVCIPINTINDEDVEGAEVFKLSLRYPDGQDDRVSIGPNDATTIYIEDDDSARLNVQFPRYTVSEGNGSVHICAAVRSPFPSSTGCPLNFSFRVRLVKTPRSAGSSDYYSSSQTIYFRACQEVSCTSFSIYNDNILEELNENFEISLESLNTPSAVRVSSQPSTITIVDNDILTIGFERTAYTVPESSSSGRVQLCANIKRHSSAITNTIRISTSPDTATTGSPSDFSTISTLLVFEPGTSSSSRRSCVDVAINNDDTVEERERFNAELLRPAALDDRVVLEPSSASVFITDNDYASVSMVGASRKAREGETVDFVINTGGSDCPVGFEFNVTFTASRPGAAGNADESDYSFPEIVTVPACRNGTLTVRILNDEIVERDEKLIITVRIIHSRIRYRGGSITITITDDTVAKVCLQHTYLEVEENDGTASICAIAKNEDGRPIKIDFPFKVEFNFTKDSASNPKDFTTSRPRPVGTYNPNTNQSCVRLTIVDSYSVEMPESLFVSIRLLDDDISSITIDPRSRNGTIVINDDDEATIGLSKKIYYLDDDATSLEICLSISEPNEGKTNCPIAFPFNIIFRLASDATIAAFEVDPDQEDEDEDRIRNRGRDTILLFNSCQREFCFIVNQINGTIVNSGERFSISVARTPDHGITILLDEDLKTGFIEIR